MSEPTGQERPSTPPRRPQGLLIASTLCWLWGILMALSGVALIIPAVAVRGMASGPAFLALGFLVLAVAYCVAGYHVRKARLIGGWIAVVAAGLMSALQLGFGAMRTAAVGLVVNVAIVALVVWNWRHLRASSGQVSADHN
jgi:hypothetical protein